MWTLYIITTTDIIFCTVFQLNTGVPAAIVVNGANVGHGERRLYTVFFQCARSGSLFQRVDYIKATAGSGMNCFKITQHLIVFVPLRQRMATVFSVHHNCNNITWPSLPTLLRNSRAYIGALMTKTIGIINIVYWHFIS